VRMFSNSFSMSKSHSILFSMFCTIFSFTSIFPLQIIMILMPSWHDLKCFLIQFEHIKTKFWNVKHSREHLLTQSILWNAEDGLNPLHVTTSAMLSARSECSRPKIKQVTVSTSYWYLLKSLSPIIQLYVSGLLYKEEFLDQNFHSNLF
jgi:hypothetical protein